VSAIALPAPQQAPQWYCLVTRYRGEKKAAAGLASKGIDTFLPLLQELHRWSDRQKKISKPLLPGYVFVRALLSTPSKLQILQTAGVIALVTFGAEPIPIPNKQIEDLQCLLLNNVPCAMRPFLQVGQKVRLRDGCLDGLEGILLEKEKSLVISVASIQRSVAIQIEGYEVELV
jgi:transcription antitermination factor NusG